MDQLSTSPYIYEREMASVEALQRIEALLTVESLDSELVYTDEAQQVSQVKLKDFRSNHVTIGNGKGAFHKVGAYAEALEHYFFEREGENPKCEQQIGLGEIAAQTGLAKDHLLQFLARENESEKICATKFYHLNGSESSWVPTAYVNPHKGATGEPHAFAESILQKYSSNTGVSFGHQVSEALLHSLNECVERHYLSLFFLDILNSSSQSKWFFAKGGFGRFGRRKKWLEQMSMPRSITVYTRTQFGPYFAVSLALEDEKGQGLSYRVQPLGSGCSFSLELALLRSLDELAQSLIVGYDETCDEDERFLELCQRFNKANKLTHISMEQLNNLASEAPEQILNFPLCLDTQVEVLLHEVSAQGYAPMYRIIKSFQKEAVVLQTYIPGFERFHLIRSGHVVAPQREMKDYAFA